ncbi:MAG: hypothetical protein Q9169_005314, partial [Polycauliona sp. 2 TL-2023]
MAAYLARAVFGFLCPILLLSGVSAQLIANVKSPGNVYIYTIEITNPTETPVSVLAWNNMFDNSTRLPVLFDVRDDEDNIVPLASTYVMRAGMSSNDFYTLAPHESFSRTIDIRQIMQHLPSGPSSPQGAGLTQKVFTITPLAAYKGVIGDASTVVAALADLASSPKKLGDLGTSNLQDITVTTKSIRGANTFPLFAGPDSTYLGTPDGTHAATDCTAQDLADVSNAIFDAGVYANSLAIAANDSTNTLLPEFISPSVHNLPGISAIAAAAVGSINGQGPHVDVHCTDYDNLCGDPNVLGYSFTPSFLGNAYIVLCPTARALGRAPAPCQTGSVGGASTSHVLLHLLMTLNNVVPTVATSSINGLLACQNLATSTLIDPTRNPDSLAQVAIAEWGYGFGGPPYSGATCLPAEGVPSRMKKRASSSFKHQTESNSDKQDKLATRRREHSSPQNLSRRQRRQRYLELEEDLARTTDCSRRESAMLRLAVENARAMARWASADLSSTSPESSARWTTYFNGDSTVRATVKKNFDMVAS